MPSPIRRSWTPCCSVSPSRCSARAPGTPIEVAWPQPHGYQHRHGQGEAAHGRGGLSNGFETTLSFDLGFAAVNEPQCVLIQESLGQIGIRATINKMPGANWRTELNKKMMPLYTNVFSGWLDYPEYFFFWCYDGQNSVFNTMSYQSKTMDAFIDGARAGRRHRRQGDLRQGREGLRRARLHRHPAHPALSALRQCRDAEERIGLPILVPSPARLPGLGEGVRRDASDHVRR